MPVEPIRYRLLGDEEWVQTLERQLALLAPGAHVCPIYDTPEEHFHALTPFCGSASSVARRVCISATTPVWTIW